MAKRKAIDLNPWDLFEDHPKFAEATAALDTKWAEQESFAAKWFSPSRIVVIMHSVMEKYAEVGASDSEPMNVLDRRIFALLRRSAKGES